MCLFFYRKFYRKCISCGHRTMWQANTYIVIFPIRVRRMKTIFVKDIARRLVLEDTINWKKVVPTIVFLGAMFLLGRMAAEVYAETAQTIGSKVLEGENWGLGFGGEGQKPTGNAAAEELKKYNAYFCGEGQEKVIYLTFDCGYENGNTEPILDALKKHNAPATFFVVGHFLESAPEIVKRMVEDGHSVGNHTYHHPDMSKISDKSSFQKEMDDVKELFKEITGTEMAMYYRPRRRRGMPPFSGVSLMWTGIRMTSPAMRRPSRSLWGASIPAP